MNRRTLLFVAAVALATAVFVPGPARAQGSSGTGPAERRGCASASQLDCRNKLYDSHDYHDAISNSTGEKSVDQRRHGRRPQKFRDFDVFGNEASKPANAKPAGAAKGNKDAKQYQDQIFEIAGEAAAAGRADLGIAGDAERRHGEFHAALQRHEN